MWSARGSASRHHGLSRRTLATAGRATGVVQPEHSPGRLTSNLFRVLREAGPSDSLSEPYEVCTQRQRTGDAGAEPLHVPEAGSAMRQVGTERSRGHRPSPQSGDRQQRQPAPHGCPLTLNSASSAPALRNPHTRCPQTPHTWAPMHCLFGRGYHLLFLGGERRLSWVQGLRTQALAEPGPCGGVSDTQAWVIPCSPQDVRARKGEDSGNAQTSQTLLAEEALGEKGDDQVWLLISSHPQFSSSVARETAPSPSYKGGN